MNSSSNDQKLKSEIKPTVIKENSSSPQEEGSVNKKRGLDRKTGGTFFQPSVANLYELTIPKSHNPRQEKAFNNVAKSQAFTVRDVKSKLHNNFPFPSNN